MQNLSPNGVRGISFNKFITGPPLTNGRSQGRKLTINNKWLGDGAPLSILFSTERHGTARGKFVIIMVRAGVLLGFSGEISDAFLRTTCLNCNPAAKLYFHYPRGGRQRDLILGKTHFSPTSGIGVLTNMPQNQLIRGACRFAHDVLLYR